MGRPTKGARPRQEVQVDILNRLTIKPSLKAAAREVGDQPRDDFQVDQGVGRRSVASLSIGLGTRTPSPTSSTSPASCKSWFLEHEARSLATLGHAQARWHDGRPCYRHDPKIEADALVHER